SPRIAQTLAHALVAVISSLESRVLSQLLGSRMTAIMAALDVATLSARALDTLLAQGRQHELVDAVLAGVVRKLDDEVVRERIAVVLTEALHLEEVRVMGVSLGGTLRPLVRSGAERLVGRLQDELNAAAQDAAHPWREAVDVYLAECALRLKGDVRWRAKVAKTVAALASDPALDPVLEQLWLGLKAWLAQDSRRPDSQLANGCHSLVQTFGERLRKDDKLQGRLNRRLLALLPAFVGYYRTSVAIFISDKLDSWSPVEVSSRIELAIGRDLQYIRINGTLVGGIIGLVLFSLSRLLHA
ncbi:DUF445 family protein, partial [Craterilacuibacter sp.]|uniref:DUF445 family protein n=1 Tax=Craterilacuibacter sp. TaxID=2870909 RepID=UPI003F3FCA8D